MNWCAKTVNSGSPFEQGLIADEDTGASIAVSYDPQHAPLLAAAPALLEALVALVDATNTRSLAYDDAVAAIAKAGV